MKHDIDSVNHVGLVVEDIGAVAGRVEEFGFILTPLSMHSGTRKPGLIAVFLQNGIPYRAVS